MHETDDTIVAISTPPGRGGIGIVRLSGPQARPVAESLVTLKRPLEANRARFGHVMDADSQTILDQAVVTWFRAPRSYTGEDVVEIAIHSAPVLLTALLNRSIAAGARLAAPGEFTERAFLAGRIDLTQAEAVDDLIQATTLEQARTAARQLGGDLSRQLKPIKSRLIDLIAAMEAGIDFAEDDLEADLGIAASDRITQSLALIEAPLAAMEAGFAYGRVLREGFRLAIVGRPNAGKSSLFNRLLRRDRAIVTAQPGTTRDTVAERLDFDGVPVEVLDTAGLRDSDARGAPLDEAEAIGVLKSREAMAEADVVLLVVAADQPLHEEDRAVLRALGSLSPDSRSAGLVMATNKSDLPGASASFEAATRDAGKTWPSHLTVVQTSALKNTGIDELRSAILAELNAIAPAADTATVTNLRQQHAISAATKAVRAASLAVTAHLPHEVVLIDLHEALAALDALTGSTHTEEILALIFSRFCIGK